MTGTRPPTIAIIGGGFTGAAIAWHFARLPARPARLVIVEPRANLGGGLAYSADDPAFRINVPAAKMSIDPDDGDDFARWVVATGAVAGDPDAVMPDGRSFPQRAVFGAYVVERIVPILAAGRLEHIRAKATAMTRRSPAGFDIELDDGRQFAADLVILATTHPPPEPPAILARSLAGHPAFVADTTKPGAFAGIGPDDRVLVVGIGLTGADAIAALDRRRHRGPITAISRRGLRSRGHAPVAMPARGDFSSARHATACGLLRAVRGEITAAEADGLTWHAVLDAVRSQGPAIWSALSPEERHRLVRHLRAFWDVHRFRVAPQVEAALDRRIADGRLAIFAASIVAAESSGRAVAVTLRRRRGPTITAAFDAVLVATGPSHGGILRSLPLAASLASRGLIQPDPSGLGILTDVAGHAVDQTGRAVGDLLIAGPLARGTFGELMGLPEVSLYARFIALETARWRSTACPRRRRPSDR